MDKFPGNVNELGNWMDSYERDPPAIFSGDIADTGAVPLDKFTQNVIDNYAVEGKSSNPGGGPLTGGYDNFHPKPTGEYFLYKKAAKTVAKEILCTHFKKCGDDATEYLDEVDVDVRKTRWEDAWNYWDVNDTGKIDAIGSSVMYRHLCKPLGELTL
jgi:hypothetical protein